VYIQNSQRSGEQRVQALPHLLGSVLVLQHLLVFGHQLMSLVTAFAPSAALLLLLLFEHVAEPFAGGLLRLPLLLNASAVDHVGSFSGGSSLGCYL
jgi:hypothetical protein